MGREGGRTGQIQQMALDPVGSSEGKTHSGQPRTGGRAGLYTSPLTAVGGSHSEGECKLGGGGSLRLGSCKGTAKGLWPVTPQELGHNPLFLEGITKHRAAAKAAGSGGNDIMRHF